jgi:hypothetical protein
MFDDPCPNCGDETVLDEHGDCIACSFYDLGREAERSRTLRLLDLIADSQAREATKIGGFRGMMHAWAGQVVAVTADWIRKC